MFLTEIKAAHLAMNRTIQRKWHQNVQTIHIYSHVYCSNIHNSQETETPVCPLTGNLVNIMLYL